MNDGMNESFLTNGASPWDTVVLQMKFLSTSKAPPLLPRANHVGTFLQEDNSITFPGSFQPPNGSGLCSGAKCGT